MLNILDVHLPANHMEDNLLTSIYTYDIQTYLQDVWWKRSKKWCNSVSTRMLLLTLLYLQKDFLASNGMTLVSYPSSTNLQPSFLKWKLSLKETSQHQND
jgi:hypothetical protein